MKSLSVADLPGAADLAWASFPCQDLSLAGGGAGLKGARSGTFWPFWDLMRSLKAEERHPALIVLENVCGTLTSHKGADFSAICNAFRETGYQFGAVVIDAAMFVPQSRPRLFIIGVRNDVDIPGSLQGAGPASVWHNRALRNAHESLSGEVKDSWIWWNFRAPALRNVRFSDLTEDDAESVSWHTAQETQKLLEMMSPVNCAKVEQAKKAGRKIVGTIYKRTRKDEAGRKIQRAEARFDDVAGCLRTPAGGSSRQLILL